MREIRIDINCDLGEGIGNDLKIMPFISSCSIACGGHTGTAESMQGTVNLAMLHQVKIGAHPSYPDPKNFGRVSMNLNEEVFISSIRSQIEALQFITIKSGTKLHHIKPHGALYNDIAMNDKKAIVFLKAVAPFRESQKLYVPYKSRVSTIAIEQGFNVVSEAFADRRYSEASTLVTRTNKNAILFNESDVLKQTLQIIKEKEVTVITGGLIPMKAQTICIHGDHPKAATIVKILAAELHKQKISIA